MNGDISVSWLLSTVTGGSSDGSSGRRGSQAPSSTPNARAISELTPPNPLRRSPPVHLIDPLARQIEESGKAEITCNGAVSPPDPCASADRLQRVQLDDWALTTGSGQAVQRRVTGGQAEVLMPGQQMPRFGWAFGPRSGSRPHPNRAGNY
jgi:hypothetical protein